MSWMLTGTREKWVLKTALCISAILLIFPHACQLDQEKNLVKGNAVPDMIDFNFHVKPILSDRCFKCHGPDPKTREGDLRLDTPEGALAALGAKKDHFAIVPGEVEKSTLVERIFSEDPQAIMPPPESNLVLEAYEKEVLKKWIEQGAQWKKHWSFLPLEKPQPPQQEEESWGNNEIDAFVFDRLLEEGLRPAAPATKEQLIRRLSFDLRGLPPSLEEIDTFLADDSPNAYNALVDRLLATDAYAENMTVDWLDLARYADTHGYQDDLERIMFPWRDWVIHAFKNNMPYDQFVEWQLAGDMLPEASREQVIASAFNRNHKITQEGGVIPEEYRVEYVSDRTQTFGAAFLGLTVECARCHDHKYDPISQKDFYSLFSFFNNVPEEGLIEPYGAIPEPYIVLTKQEIEEQLHFINNLDTLAEIPLMVMQEMEEPRQAYILRRGAYDQQAEAVEAATPAAILPYAEPLERNRRGLAKWLFSPENPLTARVAVNRLWQRCFGTGIVATPEDFGSQGALPSHPKLLDWLSIRFMETGWDMKAMLKYIVSSATYQQSSKVEPELLERDPENRLLARAPRLRLSAEKIRDHVLAISQLLNPMVGGPGMKPYQPPGLWAETTGGGGGSTARYVEDTGDRLYRRSLYTFWKRTVPPPSMMIFDAASRDFCTLKRESTSTPLQALVLLNDPQVIEASRVLAYRAVREKAVLKDRIALMFRLATSRRIKAEEFSALEQYFESEWSRLQASPEEAEGFLAIGAYEQKDLLPPPEMAAYALLANVILNLDETITRS